MIPITRALLSVSNKDGLVEFAKALHERGVELLSTGGTAKALREADLPVIDVADYTGSPELFEGRVKTLHPKVHGGLLFKRLNPQHEAQATQNGIGAIDLVAVNLYPFEETVAKEGSTIDDAIENIDIGGPSMLRSAAKNHESVTVVVDPADYARVLAEMEANDGATTLKLRQELAVKVFATTSRYDHAIDTYLAGALLDNNGSAFPSTLNLWLPKVQDLRYGENPAQKAALYGDFDKRFLKLQGKELSYTNILDLTSAHRLIGDLGDIPALAILKHMNPCGVAVAPTLLEAWELAYETDKQAPFGGVIAVNQEFDGAVAERVKDIFCEIIVAPSFSQEALVILEKKHNLRLMVPRPMRESRWECRSVPGGMLVQERDTLLFDEMRVVTERAPTEDEDAAMPFLWAVCKHVKSNAIVVGKKCPGNTFRLRTLGIGAGQMSRVDSAKICPCKARMAGIDGQLEGAVAASDAFIPFPDVVEVLADAGVTAIIQTGGSIRDAEVIATANSLSIAMVFTGVRHFRH